MTTEIKAALEALGWSYWGGDGNNGAVWEHEDGRKITGRDINRNCPEGELLVGMLMRELDEIYRHDWTLQSTAHDCLYGFGIHNGWHFDTTLLSTLTTALKTAKEKLKAKGANIEDTVVNFSQIGQIEAAMANDPDLEGM